MEVKIFSNQLSQTKNQGDCAGQTTAEGNKADGGVNARRFLSSFRLNKNWRENMS